MVTIVDGQVSLSVCLSVCPDSPSEDQRAIFTVRSRCRSGSVAWSSAYGALRLALRPALLGGYRLCFVLVSQHALSQVSLETGAGQGSRVMTRLVATSGRSGEVCVAGRAGRGLRLFLEVERPPRFTGLPALSLDYDVQPAPDAQLAHPMEGGWPHRSSFTQMIVRSYVAASKATFAENSTCTLFCLVLIK